jgi:hypothetical protein
MTYHSPPVMVAIGLPGDEADRNQSATIRWSPPTATATGVPASMQSEDVPREMPGFSVGDPCATKSAQIYHAYPVNTQEHQI